MDNDMASAAAAAGSAGGVIHSGDEVVATVVLSVSELETSLSYAAAVVVQTVDSGRFGGLDH